MQVTVKFTAISISVPEAPAAPIHGWAESASSVNSLQSTLHSILTAFVYTFFFLLFLRSLF